MRKQSKLVLLYLLITILCVFILPLVHPLAAFSEVDIFSDLNGQWINKGYLDDIAKNKFPIKTINKYQYAALIMHKGNKDIDVCLIINFHEGLNFNLAKNEHLK